MGRGIPRRDSTNRLPEGVTLPSAFVLREAHFGRLGFIAFRPGLKVKC